MKYAFEWLKEEVKAGVLSEDGRDAFRVLALVLGSDEAAKEAILGTVAK